MMYVNEKGIYSSSVRAVPSFRSPKIMYTPPKPGVTTLSF